MALTSFEKQTLLMYIGREFGKTELLQSALEEKGLDEALSTFFKDFAENPGKYLDLEFTNYKMFTISNIVRKILSEITEKRIYGPELRTLHDNLEKYLLDKNRENEEVETQKHIAGLNESEKKIAIKIGVEKFKKVQRLLNEM